MNYDVYVRVNMWIIVNMWRLICEGSMNYAFHISDLQDIQLVEEELLNLVNYMLTKKWHNDSRVHFFIRKRFALDIINWILTNIVWKLSCQIIHLLVYCDFYTMNVRKTSLTFMYMYNLSHKTLKMWAGSVKINIEHLHTLYTYAK